MPRSLGGSIFVTLKGRKGNQVKISDLKGCNMMIKSSVYSWLYNNIVRPLRYMEERHEAPHHQDIYCFLQPPAEHQSYDMLSFQDLHHQQPPEHNPLPFINSFLYESPLLAFAVHPENPLSELLDQNPSQKKKYKKGIKKAPKKKKSKKRRKSKIDDNSPFHNCQKHLNIALKKMLIFPEDSSETEQQVKPVAESIWKAFQKSRVKTKRILHFIFNEDNEFKVNDEELKEYGLFEIYQQYGEQTYNAAKNYLSKLAIDQLDESSITCYVNSTKIRDKLNFNRYMNHFRQELEQGYLKRRIIPDSLPC